MIEVISHTEQTARKDYHDDLRDIFDYGWRPIGMTISERRTWIKYRDRRGIKKGDKYVRQFKFFRCHTNKFIQNKQFRFRRSGQCPTNLLCAE